MAKRRLSNCLFLYQRRYCLDERGGQYVEWEKLGQVWGSMKVQGKTDAQEKGVFYQAIVRYEQRILLTDKVVWNEKDYFLVGSPQQLNPHYLVLRLFAWRSHVYL